MDDVFTYCSTRYNLEEKHFGLVTKFASAAERLADCAGIDRTGFVASKHACADLRIQIAENRADMDAHRAAHGC